MLPNTLPQPNTQSRPMNFYDLFPSRFLKGHDLKGATFTFTIARATLETVRNNNGAMEEHPIIYFEKARKGLLLNKTNALTLTEAYGPDMHQWSGKPVTLYTIQLNSFGKTRDVVRLRVE